MRDDRELLADALQLAAGQWRVTFQSQFGREEWLRPYTGEVLEHLGQEGVRSVLVACPGFTADCLETLDEIAREGEEQSWRVVGSSTQSRHA